jgi:iron complex outermembrane recepter protein
VQVLTAADLQPSACANVQQVLTRQSGSGQATLSQSFNGASAGGAPGIALRGLTVGGMLTLNQR